MGKAKTWKARGRDGGLVEMTLAELTEATRRGLLVQLERARAAGVMYAVRVGRTDTISGPREWFSLYEPREAGRVEKVWPSIPVDVDVTEGDLWERVARALGFDVKRRAWREQPGGAWECLYSLCCRVYPTHAEAMAAASAIRVEVLS